MNYFMKLGYTSDLGRIYKKMRADFHYFERIPEPFMRRAMHRGEQELLLFADENGREAGYAFCGTRSMYGYVLLNYLAVDESMRGTGIGSAALRLIFERYADRRGLIIELTDAPGEEEEMKRRHVFYERAGFVDVPCDYRLGGKRAYLMAKPLSGTADIAAIAHRLMQEFYGRMLPAPLLKKVLQARPAESFADGEEDK